jgi:hypothetical protein
VTQVRGFALSTTSAPTADALEFFLEILVDLLHCLIGRAALLDILRILNSWLPMTYRGLQ